MSNIILGRHHVALHEIILIGSVCIQDTGDVYASYHARLAESSGICYIVLPASGSNNSNLIVVDATTPSNPTRKSKTTYKASTFLNFSAISTHGVYPEILLPNRELQIWNCTDPTSPTNSSTTALVGARYWISAWTSGGSKYVAFNRYTGAPTYLEYLRCYNVDNPAAPSLVGSVLSEYSDWGPYSNGSIFIHAIDIDKYVWFDVSDPTNPAEVVRWDTALSAMYGPLVATNGRLYSVDYNYSYAFRLYDVSSSPSHPLESTTSINKFPGAATCRDNYLFTGADDTSPPDYFIESWDTTDMTNPVAVAQASGVDIYAVADMVVDGSYIYVVAQKTTDSGKYYLLVFQLIGF